MGHGYRYSQPGSRMTRCYQLWSRTDTGTHEWLLQPVAMTMGFLQSPASPSSPRGLNQSEKRKRGLSAVRQYGQCCVQSFILKVCVLLNSKLARFYALHIMTKVPQLNHRCIFSCIVLCYSWHQEMNKWMDISHSRYMWELKKQV